MSGLLINERFVAVFPSLVRLLGSLESAVILQHLHFCADESGDIRTTRQEIADATGISIHTITRRLTWLREEGLVEARREEVRDATLTYRIDHRALQSRGLQSANPGVSDLPTSSIQKVRTTTTDSPDVETVATGAVVEDFVADTHDRQSMTVDWTPRPVFMRWLMHRYERTASDLDLALTRFRAYQIDNNRFSRSWENTFEAWVAEDFRRQQADIDHGATDDLGRPLSQRARSAYEDTRTIEEIEAEADELARLAAEAADAVDRRRRSVTEQEQPE